MYLGLVLVSLGIAFWVGTPPMFAVPIFVFAIANWVHIPFEEAKMRRQFGGAFDADHHIHPFSDTAALNKEGVRVITKADGVYLWDSEGNKIIDGMSGLWCVQLGYGNRELADAGYEALRTLPYYNHFFKTSNPYT